MSAELPSMQKMFDAKRISRILLSFTLLFLFAQATMAAPAKGERAGAQKSKSKEEKGTGWLILYKHPMIGRIEVRVSPWGSLFSNPMFSFIVRLPDYKLVIFNTETHKCVTFSKEDALRRISLLIHQTDKKYKFTPWKEIGPSQLKGIDCKIYRRDLANPGHNARVRTEYHEMLYVAPYSMFGDPKAVAPLMEPISRTLARGNMSVPGWVIEQTTFWKKWRDGRLVTDEPSSLIELDSIKKTTFKKSDFEVEKTYTHVKDETEVMMHDDGEMGGMLMQFKQKHDFK